jgi:hypothetical protein
MQQQYVIQSCTLTLSLELYLHWTYIYELLPCTSVVMFYVIMSSVLTSNRYTHFIDIIAAVRMTTASTSAHVRKILGAW